MATFIFDTVAIVFCIPQNPYVSILGRIGQHLNFDQSETHISLPWQLTFSKLYHCVLHPSKLLYINFGYNRTTFKYRPIKDLYLVTEATDIYKPVTIVFCIPQNPYVSNLGRIKQHLNLDQSKTSISLPRQMRFSKL